LDGQIQGLGSGQRLLPQAGERLQPRFAPCRIRLILRHLPSEISEGDADRLQLSHQPQHHFSRMPSDLKGLRGFPMRRDTIGRIHEIGAVIQKLGHNPEHLASEEICPRHQIVDVALRGDGRGRLAGSHRVGRQQGGRDGDRCGFRKMQKRRRVGWGRSAILRMRGR
jgi:hypothetical protein